MLVISALLRENPLTFYAQKNILPVSKIPRQNIYGQQNANPIN